MVFFTDVLNLEKGLYSDLILLFESIESGIASNDHEAVVQISKKIVSLIRHYQRINKINELDKYGELFTRLIGDCYYCMGKAFDELVKIKFFIKIISSDCFAGWFF